MNSIAIWGLSEPEYKNLQEHEDFSKINVIRIEEMNLLQRVDELLGGTQQKSEDILADADFKNYVAKAVKDEQARIVEMVCQPAALSSVLEKIKGWSYFLLDVDDLENCLNILRKIVQKKQSVFSRITPLARYWYLSSYLLELQAEHMMMKQMYTRKKEQARSLSKES